jgi:uncharacterized damage-inducible protein DinB
MDVLPALLDHARWADARARDALASLPPDSPARAQALRVYAHLAAASHVWDARLAGREPAHPVWPTLTFEAASALAATSLDSLRAHAADTPAALTRVVEYRTSGGQTFRNTVTEILTHVALHASYHCGQLALLTRQGGGTPAATDYVVFLRDGAALGPVSLPRAPGTDAPAREPAAAS